MEPVVTPLLVDSLQEYTHCLFLVQGQAAFPLVLELLNLPSWQAPNSGHALRGGWGA